jgi:MFS family permease
VTQEPAIAAIGNPLTLFKNNQFLRLWVVGGLGGAMRWLEILVLGIYAFDVSGSPLVVSLMVVARMAPMVLFGTLIGAVVDRLDRRATLIVAFAGMALGSVYIAVCSFDGDMTLWVLALVAFCNGLGWSTDFPVRRTLISDAVEPARLGTAMAFDSATNSLTRMLGPLIGGVVYQWLGLSSAFMISAAVYGLILLCVLGLPRSAKRLEKNTEGLLQRLMGGFRYARQQKQILGVLLLTTILNFFAFSFAGLVPVWAVENFVVDPIRISFLVSAEGGGAFCGAVILAYFARPARFQQIFFFGAVIFVSGVMIVAKLPIYGLALAILFIGGIGISGFGAMQSTIVLNACSLEYRSRVMGVVAACIGAGPLGVLLLGWVAEHSSASSAILMFSSTGMALIIVTVLCLPGIKR